MRKRNAFVDFFRKYRRKLERRSKWVILLDILMMAGILLLAAAMIALAAGRVIVRIVTALLDALWELQRAMRRILKWPKTYGQKGDM